MRRVYVAIILAVVVVIAFVFFVPVINTKTSPPIDQLAFLGPLPATESLSCAILGVGSGYWQTATTTNPTLQWSYLIGCPPKP